MRTSEFANLAAVTIDPANERILCWYTSADEALEELPHLAAQHPHALVFLVYAQLTRDIAAEPPEETLGAVPQFDDRQQRQMKAMQEAIDHQRERIAELQAAAYAIQVLAANVTGRAER